MPLYPVMGPIHRMRQPYQQDFLTRHMAGVVNQSSAWHVVTMVGEHLWHNVMKTISLLAPYTVQDMPQSCHASLLAALTRCIRYYRIQEVHFEFVPGCICVVLWVHRWHTVASVGLLFKQYLWHERIVTFVVDAGVTSAMAIVSTMFTRTNFHVEEGLLGAINLLCHGSPKIW